MKTRFILKAVCVLTMFWSLNIFQTKAQIVEMATDLAVPRDLYISENFLYYANLESGTIDYIALAIDNPTPNTIFSGLDSPLGICKSGNYLYVKEGFSTISKIDITTNPPIKTTFLDNLQFALGMTIADNVLYYAEMVSQMGGEVGRVSKIDLSDENATPIVLSENLNSPSTILQYETDLYIVQNTPFPSNRRITKIDLTGDFPTTPTEVVTNFSANITAIAIRGNELYTVDRYLDDSRVVKADISGELPVTPTDFLGGLYNIMALSIHENDLYMVETGLNMEAGEGKILKYTFEPAVGIGEIAKENTIVAYPNPATDYIYLSNLTKKSNYMLMDVAGKIILKGEIDDLANAKISIAHLENGMYFLKCEEEIVPFYKK